MLIKNSKGEGGGKRKERETKKEVGGGGHSNKQSEGLGGIVWVYKIGLNHSKKLSLSLYLRETKNWNSSA